MENVPGTDDSIQQCLIVPTTPGVGYRVEWSHDLHEWTTQDEIYGLGFDFVVPMREFTPAPAPVPGTSGGPVVPPPALKVSLFVRFAAGSTSGTVVSWKSLDHGGAMNHFLPLEMTAGWSQVPFFWERFDDHDFFIACSGASVAPPEPGSPLGTKDAAMIACLTDHFEDINSRIDDSMARARNSPPPAPPDPDAKKFWRIFCDAGIDTDGDGSPDWAEFEIATRGSGMLVAGVRGDAFNPDTNGDGIPDGEQLDADLDGTADAHDPDAADNTATYPVGPIPRYALFPITNAEPTTEWPVPLQISDRGTVLYTNGTWSAGTWTPLIDSVEGFENARARAINDSDVILGLIDDDETQSTPIDFFGSACFWSNPAAQPAIIETSGGIRAASVDDGQSGIDLGDNLLGPGPVLGNDGGFYFPANQLNQSTGNWFFLRQSRWTLPLNGQAVTETAVVEAEHGLRYSAGPDLQWGFDDDHLHGRVQAPNPLPPLPFVPVNVAVQPSGVTVAMPSINIDERSRVYANGMWQASELLAQAVDMAADGTAIGRSHDGRTAPILINGKWTDIKRTAPRAENGWNDASVTPLDTTSEGWILARRGPTASPEWLQYGALLPIRAKCLYVQEFNEGVTTEKYTGVDDFSIGAIFTSESVKDRIWIMAPKGGAPKSITFNTPVDGVHPLVLSASGIDFGNVNGEAHLSMRPSIATLQATETAESGTDIAVNLRFAQTSSSSKPLGIKVMKARTVKVTIYKVTKQTPGSPDNTADHVPDAGSLEKYLNDIFSPQVIVRFTVTSAPEPLALNWDHDPENPADPLNDNGILDLYPYFPSPEQKRILDARPEEREDSNIDLFFVGTDTHLGGDSWGSSLRANPDEPDEAAANACWIVGDALGNREMGSLLQTVAHEIGHVLVGLGHPNASDPFKRGPANLPGTNHSDRLMVSGTGYRILRGHLLVKQEWDEAEKWLHSQIDTPTP